ncbi:polysaccharide export outer membrane protein [Chitinophaga sp. YR573]|uniref:polysaccharide biosynthesis/export family protein n=1 Tax=Chitinophaga sp. YR573 TaxID=1881040 RepID=UPI0008C06353|nr:polysaccharide biosynthesis/export family protein [Chitinophaga sp. YR573]SEW44437.1 polysaccharide export outer membrane protein [Chitinophaga sp. YR573]
MKILNWGKYLLTHSFTRKKFLLFALSSAFLSLLLSSCVTTKNVRYFKDVPDTLKKKVVDQATFYTPVIQPDDILQVTIQTLDPSTNTLLNPQASWPITGNAAPSAGSTGVSGYLVGKDGYVVLPLAGKILVKGKTTDEVREDIRIKASEFYHDPLVNVRYANFKITVLGEVSRPSTYVMPNEKVTLLDALGAAGDLTIYGRRENVLLIRDRDGKKEFTRFNLNNSSLFNSPYFYLQQGDVVYVEPNRSKVISTDAARLRVITILTTGISLLTLIITRVRF